MAQSPNYPAVFQRYHETQSKFDYFVVGSTLAILAFSIQYTQHSNLDCIEWLIVFSWTNFLLSFLIGLWRLESLVLIRGRDVDREVNVGIEPPKEWVEYNEKLSKNVLWAYRFQKTLLVLGLTAYALFHIVNFLNRN